MIQVWDRHTQELEEERVYGDALVRFSYGTRLGRFLSEAVLARRWVSKLVGAYKSTRHSARAIPAFVRDYGIPMEEFEPEQYASFNDFFIRRFRAGARRFCKEPRELSAFAEGRYLAYREVTPELCFPVKGEHLSAAAILADRAMANRFEGGPVLIARLCPLDYHRFHYPDDGRCLQRYRAAGKLHSVNPLALTHKSDIFVTNERCVSILETAHFGRLAYVEVGAICVGRIVHSHPEKTRFARGEERGYFLFGGSTVILMGEPDAWIPDEDLVEQTRAGVETHIRLGERVALAGTL